MAAEQRVSQVWRICGSQLAKQETILGINRTSSHYWSHLCRAVFKGRGCLWVQPRNYTYI